VKVLDRPEGVVPDIYFSFADDAGFNGVVVMEGPDAREAFAKLAALGLNPGGEVLIYSIPPGEMPREQLLSLADLRLLGLTPISELPPEDLAQVYEHAVMVCGECNVVPAN
jgi:hypothetical protein